jgi:ESS family glutamate:Na+ symporter
MGVAAALGAISLSVVGAFWLPILVMSTVAGVLAYVLIPALGRWIYPDRVFARSLIVYGSATGTLSTGLALLRVVDPEFKSPVSTDFMYASTMVFAAAAPMIVFLLDMPARGYTTGNPVWYWVSLAICAAYLAAVALMHVALARGLRRRRAAAGAAGVKPQAARVAG